MKLVIALACVTALLTFGAFAPAAAGKLAALRRRLPWRDDLIREACARERHLAGSAITGQPRESEDARQRRVAARYGLGEDFPLLDSDDFDNVFKGLPGAPTEGEM